MSEVVKFGTFGGVFTPCMLTILGVIMFLRFGQVVGEAGLWHALAIVAVAKAITLLTACSLSAIATNTRVKGGGAYFLISRSLGVEFGGVIGIVLFLAQAVSVSMYIIGFTEAFLAAFPQFGFTEREISSFVNLLCFVCVYIGAGWTIRLQYGILAILLLSVVVFFAGAIPQISLANLESNGVASYAAGSSPFVVFALFFPAVTGIMAGANMSGDLEDPGRSIPLGTLAAVAVTAVIYSLIAVMLALAVPKASLLADPLIVKQVSISPFLFNAGVFAATLSSALASMMGAPRILQAFGRDDIFRPARIFAVGSGPLGEPRRATVLTLVIAELGVLAGDLNAIAPIITMFFIVTYGTLNLACFYEGITNNPSFRPRFRLSHWSLALLGAIGCGVAMLLINPLWAALSILVTGLIFFLIRRAEIQARWGNLASGVAYERARRALLRLENERYDPKNWRPAILAVSRGLWRRVRIAEYAHWMTAGRGITTLGQVMRENSKGLVDHRREAESLLRRFIREERLEAFPVVVVNDSVPAGIESLLQAHGIGGLRPNTVLLALPDEEESWDEFCESLRVIDRYERNVVIVDCPEVVPEIRTRDARIDVLWQGSDHGELMVLLGYLLKLNHEWRTSPLRILATLPPKGDADNLRDILGALLKEARIDATVHVYHGDELYVTLARRTGNSAALMVQFDPPEPGEEEAFREWTRRLSRLVPDIIYVHSARGVSLRA